MKEVSGSDELAMNIKLKEDKKKFVFGDIRAGYGNNRFYESNASLFYYTPKINWSIIGNLNNFGTENPLLVYPWKDDLFLNTKNKEGHQLRPHIVWFGEAVPEMERAITKVAATDVQVCRQQLK